MSSIIDALKKSDKNRTTETGANVNQIKFGNEPPEKSRRGFWLLVMILLLVAGAVFAWQRGWHHRVIAKAHQWLGNDAKTEQVATTNNNVSPERVKPPEQTQTKVNNSQTATTATQKANKLTPPKADEVKAKSITAAEETSAELSQQPPKEDTINTEMVAENQEDAITVIKDNKPPQDELVNEQQARREADRKVLEPKMKQDYLLIHQIDFEIRKNIPPIKLNIHIFDPDPANRMIIMNGIKFITGDVIEELVTVKEIVKEGVVLEFENIRFLVPK